MVSYSTLKISSTLGAHLDFSPVLSSNVKARKQATNTQGKSVFMFSGACRRPWRQRQCAVLLPACS